MTATLGDLTQIPVTTQPTQGLPKLGDVSVTLYNQDITNLVFVSYQQWFTPGQGNCIPIQPLTSITISAKRAIYVASTVSGVASLLVLPEGSQAQPSPAQIAAQINTLGLATASNQIGQNTAIPSNIAIAGVPLLNASVRLLLTTGQVIASGATYAPVAVSLTKPTAEVIISLQNGAADTQPFVTLSLQWSDSASGVVLEPDTYQFACGTVAASPIVIHGILVAHGDTLTISVKNNGSTSCTMTLLVLNNSKPTNVDTELWRYLTTPTQNINSFDPFSGPSDIPTNLLSANSSSAGASGGTFSRLLPVYIGAPIQLAIHTGSGLTDLQLYVEVAPPIGTVLGYQTPIIYQNQSNGNGDIFATIWTPRSQVRLRYVNNNASARTITHMAIGTT